MWNWNIYTCNRNNQAADYQFIRCNFIAQSKFILGLTQLSGYLDIGSEGSGWCWVALALGSRLAWKLTNGIQQRFGFSFLLMYFPAHENISGCVELSRVKKLMWRRQSELTYIKNEFPFNASHVLNGDCYKVLVKVETYFSFANLLSPPIWTLFVLSLSRILGGKYAGRPVTVNPLLWPPQSTGQTLDTGHQALYRSHIPLHSRYLLSPLFIGTIP